MDAPRTSEPRRPGALGVIQEGRKVWDADGKQVGKVSGLYLGAEADRLEQPGKAPETTAGTAPVVEGEVAIPGFINFLDDDPNLAPELRKRLQYNGFVRIDAGGLHRDRYALREQVAGVSPEGVRLSITEEALIKA